MSKQVNYVQCVMRRNVANGLVRTTSYIPQPFAQLGRVLKLKDDRDRWVDGWVVEFVGHTAVKEAPDYRKAVRNHRKSTGDSQPRIAG